MINRSRSGHSADIDKNANVGLKDRTEGIEEPAMRVDLLLVLLLETEYKLYRDVAAVSPLDTE